MNSRLRIILIHFLLYIRSCFIGVLQFAILISLILLEEGTIGFVVSFFAMILVPIISLPFYLIIIAIVTVKKIKNEKIYIMGSMIVAASLPIYVTIFDSSPEYFSGIIFAVILSIFGIIPGKMYYKSSQKYFSN